MKIEYQDQIDEYLLGRMSDGDRKAFEKQVEKDDELCEQLEFAKDVLTSMKSRNEKLAKMEEWEKGKPLVATGPSPVRKVIYWVSGIAAVFVVGLFLFKNYQSQPFNMSAYMAPQHEPSPTLVCDAPPQKAAPPKDIEGLVAVGERTSLEQIEDDEIAIWAEMILCERELSSRGEVPEGVDEKMDSLKHQLDDLLFRKAQAYISLKRNGEARALLDSIRHSESKYRELADSLYQQLL